MLSATSLVNGALGASAATNPDPAPIIPCKHNCPASPAPTDSPTAVCFYGPDFCPPSPSPTPDVIVVSPVPPDPSPSPSTPSYLVGINPTPTPTPQTTDSISSPVPVGGGFVDQLPSPSATANISANDLAPHSSGLPLPFLAVGVLLILGAIGSLLYAVVPRNKPIFETARRTASTSPVMFTPYGPDTPGTNILGGPPPPRPGPGPRKRP